MFKFKKNVIEYYRMPRTKTDYSKTVIYVIKCKDNNIIDEYIGSTTNFNERKCQHKTVCYNEKSKCYNYKIYKYIRENGGWTNWLMLEVEKFPCNDKREAEKREEEIRLERKSTLNMIKAFGAETIEKYKKIYYEKNKEEIKEYNKIYHQEHKEEIKEQQKKYNEENEEEIKEYKKQWGNKEFTCKCGWIGTNSTKRTHFKKCLPAP